MPSRNESEKAARTHWTVGARHKKQWTEFCASQMSNIPPTEQPCTCTLTFYEKNYRRDNDNAIAGTKFILDALQLKNIIKNDSHKLLKLLIMPVEIDKDNPRIEIVLETI